MEADFIPGTRRILTGLIRVLTIALVLLRMGINLEGQSPGSRPRIGLALSGGGANGMAHIGVLKVMEEAGVRPDYIAGVSMLSIVGGMYALSLGYHF